MSKFNEMEIREEIKSAIESMGFEEATPIQKEAIPCILKGNDVIAIAQTGTGKTCAFGIPAIQKVDTSNDNIQVLILCPTRELVIQTGEELQALSKNMRDLRITTIYGGQQIERQIVALKKKPQIIVGTPGRIMDHMRRKTIKFANISMFVLDEADEMLNMGFREDLDVILENASEDRQTILLSATMSKDILNITKKYQKKDTVKIEIEHKTLTAPKIKQYMVGVQESNKLEIISRILDAEEITLAVIFCNTKRKVDELQEHLRIRGYQVDALHGDMKQAQRDIVMRRFKSGKTNLLIATDVAARGIDVDDIQLILNYDIPADEEYYVHRIGRTGRAGKEGKSITFVTSREMYRVKQVEKYTNAKMELYEIPSAKLLNEKKINNLLGKITKEMDTSDLTEEIKILHDYLENVEISPIEIAAVLLKMKIGKTKFQEIDTSSKNFNAGSGSSDRIRLFMTIGKLDNLRRTSLKEYVAKEASIPSSSIYDAEVLDKFSFLTVSDNVAEKIVKKLNGSQYNGRRLNIEISTGKPSSNKGGRPRRK